MKKLFTSLFAIVIFFSCSNMNTRTVNIEDISQNSYEDFEEDYHEIIKSSAPTLNFISNNWTNESLICSENEIFIFLKMINSNRFIAVTTKDVVN